MTQFKGLTSFATLTSVVYLPTSKIIGLDQRFSTGGTRTTGGTPDVAKWYAKKNKEIRVVTFTAIRLRGPGFKTRPRQKFENENFCFRRTPAVVKACHSCRVRLIKTPLYKT